MTIERERRLQSKPLHDGKATRIRVGEVLVDIGTDDVSGLLLVALDHGFDSPNVREQPLSRDVDAEPAQQQGMSLRDEKIRQEGLELLPLERLQLRLRGRVIPIIAIDQRIYRTRV